MPVVADLDLPSLGIQDSDLAGRVCLRSSRVVSTRIRVVFILPLLVVAVTVKVTSRAAASGSRPARRSPASFRRRARMPSDSWSMTSSEPSGRVFTVLSGTDLAPFLTRQARWAPVPENRIQRCMESRVGRPARSRVHAG